MISPFRRFTNGLHQLRNDFNDQADELLAFSEILALKENCLEMDDNGFYYVTASGPLEQVIPVVTHLLDKLERIQKQQKDKEH